MRLKTKAARLCLRRRRRKERARLRREAARLLARTKAGRVCICNHYPIKTVNGQPAAVYENPDGVCTILGLQPCSLLWSCPVCAAKITESRREELLTMLKRAHDKGWTVMLLTETFPHHADQDVQDLRRKLIGRPSGAHYRLMNSRPWRRWSKSVGLQGTVRAIEITFGSNGPHPHAHILLFLEDPPPDLEASTLELHAAWRDAVRGAGVDIPPENQTDFREHGLTFVTASAPIADYVAKWGLEHEMTKSHLKHGRSQEGLTPTDLLRSIRRCRINGLQTTRQKHERMYRQFALAFHGTRQLCVSDGLRAKLGIFEEEKTDAQLAEEHIQTGWEKLYELTAGERKLVCYYGAAAELLNAAERRGIAGIHRFLCGLLHMATAGRGQPPPPDELEERQPGFEKELHELTEETRSPLVLKRGYWRQMREDTAARKAGVWLINDIKRKIYER